MKDISSNNKLLLSIYCMSWLILDSEDTTVNKTNKDCGVNILIEKITKRY